MPFLIYNKNHQAQIKYYSKVKPEVINGPFIQKTIGILAICWPWVLIIGHMIMEQNIEFKGSISAYYHTGMGHLFSGGLFIIGTAMLAYRGFHCIDAMLGNAAGILAMMVALFPIDVGDGCISCTYISASWFAVTKPVHYISAFLLFTILGYFCFVIFTLEGEEKERQRYRLCGWVIAICICGLILDVAVFGESSYCFFGMIDLFLILEIITVGAFGASWLGKGGFFKKIEEEERAEEKEENKDTKKSDDSTTPILNKKIKLYKEYQETFDNSPALKLLPIELVQRQIVEVEAPECEMPE